MWAIIQLRHILIGFILSIVGTITLVALILEVAPANPLTINSKLNVDYIISPFLRQPWFLFAPEPAKYSPRILYRCLSQKIETPWIDPSIEKILPIKIMIITLC